MSSVLRTVNHDAVRAQHLTATSFPPIRIDDFLEPAYLRLLDPILNRCVVLEMYGITCRGVAPIESPRNPVRKPIALPRYTNDAPASFDGSNHYGVHPVRPDEMLGGDVLMPRQEIQHGLTEQIGKARDSVKKWLGR